MDPWLEWSLPLIVWLQTLGEGFIDLMQFFTLLGTHYFYLLVLPIVLWIYDLRTGLRVGFALILSLGVNGLFKWLVGWPRPFWVSDQALPFSLEVSYGLPSGHAQNAVVLWGGLAAAFRRRWAWVLALILILAISISRLALGMHFASDVIAGWLIGAVLLLAYLKWEAPVSAYLKTLGVRGQILVALFVSLGFILLGTLFQALTAGRSLDPTWLPRVQGAFPEVSELAPTILQDLIPGAGTLFGFGAGAALLLDWGRFSTRGKAWQLFGRYVVGVLGVGILFFGLQSIFPSEPFVLGIVLRFMRYAAAGFWITYLAPRAFILLKLAEPQTHLD